MKNVMIFIMESCPYCKQTLRWLDKLLADNLKYKNIDIEIIDESVYPEISAKYDYIYVPTFYVGGTKMHEGAAIPLKIKSILDAALEEWNRNI